MIIKKALYDVPVFNFFFDYSKTVPVDRSNHDDAIESMEMAEKIMRKDKRALLIAPEGTRRRKYSDQGQINLLPLKKGPFHVAKHTKARIVPVIVVGAGRLMPLHSIILKPGTLFVKYCQPIDRKTVESISVDELWKLTEATFHKEYFNKPDESVFNSKIDNRLAVVVFTWILVGEAWIFISLLSTLKFFYSK